MTLTLHEPAFIGLLMVISGGQIGADQGGIHAAYEMGVQTGGIAPLHFRTWAGNNPELGNKYGLTADTSYMYGPRTRRNVERSDATLIIATNLASPGCRMTIKFANELERPCYKFQLERDMTNNSLLSSVPELVLWIKKHRVTILNVAGNRDMHGDLFHYHMTYKFITGILLELDNQGLLITDVL